MSEESFPLTDAARPDFELGTSSVRVVDLFSGCGGLTLGVAQAALTHSLALEVPLAVDFEPAAAATYSRNFPKAAVHTGRVEELFDGVLGATVSPRESGMAAEIGRVDLLVGGPPCQGHSSLNNHTRGDDPKNDLYARMARAAEVLQPAFVLIENVPSVRRDKQGVVAKVVAHLAEDYAVADRVLDLCKLSLAQRRKRHVLLAARCDTRIDPVKILDEVGLTADPRDVRWAIADLLAADTKSAYDTPPKSSLENQRRMAWLLAHDAYDLPNALRPRCHRTAHSYKSMYGRLRWDGPAQTITSGFSSIGQGRYMHPELARALTAHEAARIQGFPDYFQFDDSLTRGQLATMIGNAVPPVLSRAIVGRLFSSWLPLRPFHGRA